MQSKHDRKFVCGGVALVMGGMKHSGKIMVQTRDHYDKKIKETGFLEGAPFLWIGLIYRYGIQNKLKLDYSRINKKYGDLPIALELDMEILKWADDHNLQLLEDIFMIASLEALLQIGQKYKLNVVPFVEERAKYGQIPNTIEECERYVSPHQEI